MVDINQELVEALEATLKALEWAEVTIDNEYGCRDIAGIEADGELSPDIIHAREVLAKHKAGDVGFTEEELLEIVYKKVHPTNGAIRGTISALKAAGALRLKEEKK